MTSETRNGITICHRRQDPLSHFYVCTFRHKGFDFHSSAQCFQYSMAIFFRDEEIANEILKTRNPFKCFLLVKKIHNFDNQSWRKMESDYMYDAVKAKFSSCPGLLKYLKNTKQTIICQPIKRDRYWSVGMAHDHPDIFVQEKWTGRNEMGKILMRVRDELH